MPQVTVSIAGRSYRMACGDGEEEHLEGLAAVYDAKIEDMRKAFGEIGDMRLHVMAALTLADELSEAKRKAATLEADIVELKETVNAGDQRAKAVETQFAISVQKTAERIERLARSLSAPAQQPQQQA